MLYLSLLMIISYCVFIYTHTYTHSTTKTFQWSTILTLGKKFLMKAHKLYMFVVPFCCVCLAPLIIPIFLSLMGACPPWIMNTPRFFHVNSETTVMVSYLPLFSLFFTYNKYLLESGSIFSILILFFIGLQTEMFS